MFYGVGITSKTISNHVCYCASALLLLADSRTACPARELNCCIAGNSLLLLIMFMWETLLQGCIWMLFICARWCSKVGLGVLDLVYMDSCKDLACASINVTALLSYSKVYPRQV